MTIDSRQNLTKAKFMNLKMDDWPIEHKNEGVVSKETVVLRRWGRANARNVSF